MKVSEHSKVGGKRGIEIEHDPPGTPYQVATAVGTPPRTVYRASFSVAFSLPSPESTIAIDASAAKLDGTFAPLDAAVPASAISGSSPVVVQLDGPREVKRVAFSSSSLSGSTVQLFRMDQQKVAPQETVSDNVSAGSASFSGFTDVRFAIGVAGSSVSSDQIASVTVRGQPTGPRLGLADPAHPDQVAFFWPTPKDTGNTAHAGAAFASALQTYLSGKAGDSSPAVLVVMQSDQPCRFFLSAFATGAAFASDGFAFPLLVASDLLDADGLAARVRGAGDPVSAHLRAEIGRSELLEGLNDMISTGALYDAQRFAGVTLSAETQEELAAADDVPRLNRLLLQDAFPDLVAAPAADRVLHFAGRSDVAVRLPAGAIVSKATIATEESLRSDRATNGGPNGAFARRRGVHVGSDGTSAVAVTIEDAVSATGVALPLLSLASGTVVSVDVQEDFQGSPSGKRLAGGTASLAAPGDAAWATFFFDPVVLPSGPVWLVLRATKGDAVWIGAPDEASVRVAHTADHAPPIVTALSGLRALYEIFSRSGDAATRPATTLSIAGTEVAATRDGATATYDITAALQAALAGGNGAVPLAFASAVAGTVTVHPPHVEYRL